MTGVIFVYIKGSAVISIYLFVSAHAEMRSSKASNKRVGSWGAETHVCAIVSASSRLPADCPSQKEIS